MQSILAEKTWWQQCEAGLAAQKQSESVHISSLHREQSREGGGNGAEILNLKAHPPPHPIIHGVPSGRLHLLEDPLFS